jgi:hypothetical protein
MKDWDIIMGVCFIIIICFTGAMFFTLDNKIKWYNTLILERLDSIEYQLGDERMIQKVEVDCNIDTMTEKEYMDCNWKRFEENWWI